jgi:malate dehydrogenase (oxaloacetate-decarboxylating)(NADP+)
MNKNGLKKAALQYHEQGRPGKIEVISSKPCISQLDLSLAYTPGVAEPCLEIERDPATALKYTAKGNLVAVVSNGTAVLGLGNIGALASKPVMEGKGVLFKRFADIDVFDIEVKSLDPDEVIKTVEQISPTFGGINLEDIKAPECFYIEEALKKSLDIPVFHDDQHGTAIISGAALINALEIAGKEIEDIKVVFSGAGAAGIACANFYISLGVKPENVLMTDSKGVLWNGRGDEGKNKYKDKFFRDTEARTLKDAMVGADAFCGVSAKDVLKPDMVKSMAINPIVFAMANPDPEITYPTAVEARPDVIMATGRSDYPNQVNNVLGFPYIFRGTLDVQATDINEEMKMAAAHALAKLAKEDVPEDVKHAYGDTELTFGKEYIIPKPFDPRVLVWTASAVAEAAMRTGVAKKPVNIEDYKEELRKKIDWSRQVMRKIFLKAKKDPKRIVFPEGTNPKIIWAAAEIAAEGIAKPILLGKSKAEIVRLFEESHHSLEGIEIIEPKNAPFKAELVDKYYKLRQRKGVTQGQANLDMKNYYHFANMMVKEGFADGTVAGVNANFPEVLRPALQIIGRQKEGPLVAGLYMVQHGSQQYFFGDCAVNVNPNAQQLAEITLMAAREMERLGIKPHAALLSFSNFGSVRVPETQKITDAMKIITEVRPELPIDGPIQASLALDPELMQKHFPFTGIKTRPNLLIFPNLDAANISLYLLREMSNINSIGPILTGFSQPIHILTRSTPVNNIINLTAIACVDAQKS